jgi:hypothetical protein
MVADLFSLQGAQPTPVFQTLGLTNPNEVRKCQAHPMTRLKRSMQIGNPVWSNNTTLVQSQLAGTSGAISLKLEEISLQDPPILSPSLWKRGIPVPVGHYDHLSDCGG